MRSLRPRHYAPIALAVVLFLAMSTLLARFLSAENLERNEIYAVLQAQAAGDPQGMLAHLDGCARKRWCVSTVKANAARLRRRGPVKILLLKSTTAYSLTGKTGYTRVAWTVIGRLPVVQCVMVRRNGDFLTGMSISLRFIGAPISNEADC